MQKNFFLKLNNIYLHCSNYIKNILIRKKNILLVMIRQFQYSLQQIAIIIKNIH